MNYGENFIGHFDLNANLIKDIRILLRKSGYRLWVRGGNPDRKQHAKGSVHKHNQLRTSLPLPLATYGRFYLRSTGQFVWNGKPDPKLLICKGMALGVVKIYNRNGINVKTAVPFNFL